MPLKRYTCHVCGVVFDCDETDDVIDVEAAATFGITDPRERVGQMVIVCDDCFPLVKRVADPFGKRS